MKKLYAGDSNNSNSIYDMKKQHSLPAGYAGLFNHVFCFTEDIRDAKLL